MSIMKVIAKKILEDGDKQDMLELWDLWQEMNGTALQRTYLMYILEWETTSGYSFLMAPKEIEFEDISKFVNDYEKLWNVVGVINSYGVIGELDRVFLHEVVPVQKLNKDTPQLILKEYARIYKEDTRFSKVIKRLLK